MSSTNKTSNLQLNSWLGTDVPKREDFNRDNQILDSVIAAHISDTALHTNDSEKEAWSTKYHILTYYGNGTSTRTISLSDVPFTASWGIIFAANLPPSVVDISNKVNYNYFAIFTSSGSTTGVTYTNDQLNVVQSSTAVMSYEYRNFNENGVTYICILFR